MITISNIYSSMDVLTWISSLLLVQRQGRDRDRDRGETRKSINKTRWLAVAVRTSDMQQVQQYHGDNRNSRTPQNGDRSYYYTSGRGKGVLYNVTILNHLCKQTLILPA